MDSIDELQKLFKAGKEDDAYLQGYKDAKKGKPPRTKDTDKDGVPDATDKDDDGDGIEDTADSDDDGDGVKDALEDTSEESPDPGDSGDPVEGPDAIDELGEMASDEDEAPEKADEDEAPSDGDDEAPEEVPEEGEDEGEEEEAPEVPDDGDNHDVGDLDEDGKAQSLYDELANLEKLYYAAKGLHGAGSAKAEKALDVFHRAVRKLVRANMGAKAETDNEVQKSLRKADSYEYLINTIRQLAQEDPGGNLAFVIMNKLVDRYTLDGTLQEASKLHNVNMSLIEAVLQQEGLLGAPAQDDPSIPSDIESHISMGNETLTLSLDGSDLKVTDNVYAESPKDLELSKSGPKPALFIDDTQDVNEVFRKAQALERVARFTAPDRKVSVNTDRDCPFHGASPDVVAKSHLIHFGYLKCTCNKGK